MKKKNPWIYACLIGVILGALNVLSQPTLFVYSSGSWVALARAEQGYPVTIRFIHSVQKTPVEENLVLDRDQKTFVLESTKYQSFGVGLPFMESDGVFSEEGEYFVLRQMNRHFPMLKLRTGVGTKLTLTLGGTRVLPLYERYAPGTKVDVFVAPFYMYFSLFR